MKSVYILFCIIISTRLSAQLIQPTEEQLVNYRENADFILLGEATEASAINIDDHIWTTTSINIVRKFSGTDLPSSFVLYQPGGVAYGKAEIISSFSYPQPGHYYLLHLSWDTTIGQYILIDNQVGLCWYDNKTDQFLEPTGQIISKSELMGLYGFDNEWSLQEPQLLPPPPGNEVMIDSFSPTEVTAGTGETLDIYGSGFGNFQGSGNVYFTGIIFGEANPNVTPFQSQVLLWTDTHIRVQVPSRNSSSTFQETAATGPVRVINSSGNEFISEEDLTVKYSLFNTIVNGELVLPYLQGINESGGYTLNFHSTISSDPAKVALFFTAAELWSTAIGLNLSFGPDVADTMDLNDGINAVGFSDLGLFTSSVVYSLYEYCNGKWHLKTFDVHFNGEDFAWYYGTGTPVNSMDFITTAGGAIGLAHGLSSTRNPGTLMNNITQGQYFRQLAFWDIEAGNAVIERALSSDGCNMGGYAVVANPDMGFENDISISSIPYPYNDICASNQFIWVRVQNPGIQPVSTILVHWSVDGVEQPVHIWNGSLPHNGTVIIDDIGPYNFTEGYPTISVWLEPEGDDMYTIDNSKEKIISVNTCSGPLDVQSGTLLSPLGTNCTDINNLTVRYHKNSGPAWHGAIFHIMINGEEQLPVVWTGNAFTADVNLGSYSFPLPSNIIKVWSELPNGLADTNPANDTLNYVFYNQGLAGTYTLGGADPDYATFLHLQIDILQKGVCEDVLILVRPGNYTPITLTDFNIPDGVSIVIESESGINDVFIVSPNAAPACSLKTVQHLTFRRIDFKTTTNATNVVYLDGKITDLVFDHCTISGTGTSTKGVANNGVTGTWLREIVFLSCVINNVSDGIHLDPPNNNQVTDAITVKHCTIASGDESFALILPFNVLTIENNFLTGQNTLSATEISLVANNYIASAFNFTPSNYNGITLGSNLLFYNNTVVTFSSASSIKALGTSTVIKNCIVYNYNSLGSCMQISDAIITDHNVYYTEGDILFVDGSTTTFEGVNGILEYRAFSTGNDTHSFITEPLFANLIPLDPQLVPNQHNYQISTGGANLQEVALDYFGVVRPTVGVSIGAQQIVPGHDLSLVRLDQECPGSQQVVVAVMNIGGYDVSSFNINWSIAGQNMPSAQWTGILQPGDTAFVSVSTPALSAGDDIEFSISTSLADDENSDNNSLAVTLPAALSGTFYIGPGDDFATIAAAVDHLVENGICGDVIFHISYGTYTMSSTITPFDGMEQYSVLFTSPGIASGVVITTNAPYSLLLDNVKNISFSYLTLNKVLLTGYCSNINVSDCITHAFSTLSPTFTENCIFERCSSSSAGISVPNGHHIEVRECPFIEYIALGGTDLWVHDNKIMKIEADAANEILIERNTVNAIELGGVNSSSVLTIINNLFNLNVPSSHINVKGNVFFAHNTVRTFEEELPLNLHLFEGSFKALNNIFVAETENGVCYRIDEIFDQPVEFDFDYNCYYSPSGNIVYNHMSDDELNDGYDFYLPLYDWQEIMGFDLHSVIHQVTFVSDQDSHVVPDYVIDNAVPRISQVFNDYDQTSRGLYCDYGADENSLPVLISDAGILEIITDSLCGSDESGLYLRIKNNGSGTISQVGFTSSIDNSTPQSSSWSGTILPGNSSPPIFLTTFTANDFNQHQYNVSITNVNGAADDATDNNHSAGQFLMPFSGEYIVGDGEQVERLRDMLEMVRQAGMCGPVYIKLLDGLYSEELNFLPVPGSSEINRIYIEPLNGEAGAVTVESTNELIVPNQNQEFNFAGGKHLVFRHLTLKTMYHNSVLILRQGTDDITFQNCHFSELVNQNVIETFADSQIGSVNFINCDFTPSVIHSLAAIERLLFSGCTFDHTQFMIHGAGNVIIEKCVLKDKDVLLDNCENLLLSESQFINCPLEIVDCDFSFTQPGLIKNCMVSTNTVSVKLKNSSFINIYHNTFTSSFFNFAPTTSASLFVDNTPYCRAKNNIFSNTAGGIPMGFRLSSFLESDYNDYFTTHTKKIGKAGSTSDQDVLMTLEEYYADYGFDAHSISINPEFVSATDLHILNPAMEGTAIDLPEVGSDLDGDERGASPEMGADEAVFVAYDLRVYTFEEPDLCEGNNSLRAVIRNQGSETIENFEIVVQINDSILPAIPIAQSLAFGAISNLIDLGSYSFGQDTTYFIRIWPQLPNGIQDQNILNDTTAFYGPYYTRMQGEYTIGPAGHYETIAEASQRINNNGICGSVTFSFLPGTHYGQLDLEDIDGASEVNSITLRSASGDSTDTWIEHNSGSNNDYLVLMADPVHVLIENLSFRTLNPGYNHILSIDGICDSLVVINCHFVKYPSITEGEGAGIVWSGYGFQAYNLYVQNSTFENGSFGIKCDPSNDGIIEVWNCIFHDQLNSAIIASSGRRAMIMHNEITRAQSIPSAQSASNAGIRLSSGNSTDNEIAFNYIHNFHGTGIYLYQYFADVNNNMVTTTGFSDGTGTRSAFHCQDSGYKIAHNTFITRSTVPDDDVSSTVTLKFSNSEFYMSTFRNNIVYSDNGVYAIKFIMPQGMPSSNLLDNNNFIYPENFGVFSDVAGLQDVSYATIDAFWNAYGLTFTHYSLEPYFVDYEDPHVLAGNGVSQLGLNLGYETDYDGNPRPVIPGIGADEFMPLPLDLTPHINVEIQNCNEAHVSLTINNFGTETVTVAVIHAFVNNVQVYEGAWEGNMASGGESQLDLPPLIFDHEVPLTVSIVTLLPNSSEDMVMVNDTAYYSFQNNNSLALGNDIEICEGDVHMITSTEFEAYLWNTGETSPSISVTEEDEYWLQVTDEFGCFYSDTVEVVVHPLPEPPTVQVQEENFLSSYPTGNQWYMDGSPIEGEDTQQFTANQSGEYYVVYTNAYGCSSSSAVITYVGINVLGEPDGQINLYPNPADDRITITGLKNGACTYSVKDASGRIVIRETSTVKNTMLHPNISLLPAGVYAIHIANTSFVATSKFIKE